MRYCLLILCLVLLTACGEQETKEVKKVETEVELPESIKNARALLDSETEKRTSDEVLGKKSSVNVDDEEIPEETSEESLEEWNKELDENLEELDKSTKEFNEKSKDSLDKLNAIGDISISDDGKQVVITIPESFAKNITQEEIDKNIKNKVYNDAKRNDDGSLTYTMTKDQHTKMMNETRENIRTDILKKPNVSDVKFNDDLSVVEIYLESEPTDEDRMLKASVPMTLYFYYMISGYNLGKTDVRLLNKSGELYE